MAKFVPWTEYKKALEARVYCGKCGKSKLVSGYKTAELDTARPVSLILYCDHCKGPIHIRTDAQGVEVL